MIEKIFDDAVVVEGESIGEGWLDEVGATDLEEGHREQDRYHRGNQDFSQHTERASMVLPDLNAF